MILYIKELLDQRFMTACELADSIGCTKQTMSNIMNGKSFPGEQRIKDIAQVLRVPIWRLFVDPDENLPLIGVKDHAVRCPHCYRDIEIRLSAIK